MTLKQIECYFWLMLSNTEKFLPICGSSGKYCEYPNAYNFFVPKSTNWKQEYLKSSSYSECDFVILICGKLRNKEM